MKKRRAVNILIKVVCVLFAAILIVASVLFFPLKGKSHTEIWSADDQFDISQISSVEKQEGEDFRILLLTDIQLWANPSVNKETYEDIKALINRTQPNMIVTMGDNVSGASTRFLLENMIKLLDSFEIPWAPIFGNHDNEIPMTTLNWQGDKFLESKYCLFQKGPSNLYGCGNYAVNITENGKPVQTLFMLDNGRYIKYSDEMTKEVYMGYEQIAWYEWNVNGIKESAGDIVESMVFTHFAQPQFRTAVETYGIQDEKTEYYTIPEEYGSGMCMYLPGVAPVDSGFFEKCKELGSTKNMFCGHDHENNASVTYDGITMTFGLKTGPSPTPWNDALVMGGTVVTLDANNDVHIENIEL